MWQVARSRVRWPDVAAAGARAAWRRRPGRARAREVALDALRRRQQRARAGRRRWSRACGGPAWVATLTAATTVPSGSLIGAASERSPSSSSWSTSAQPRAWILRSSCRRPLAVVMVWPVRWCSDTVGQVRVQPGVGLGGEQHPAHRRRVGGEPGADGDRHRHDPLGRDAGDVDDVAAVEFGDRGRLVDLLDELLQVRHGDLGEGQAGQVGVAELEDLGRSSNRPPAVRM